MISLFILLLHAAAGTYAFIDRRKKGTTADGFLAVAFVTIIFSVGWTLSTAMTNLIFAPGGLAEWLDADTIALILVTLGEIVFYYLLLRHAEAERTKSAE